MEFRIKEVVTSYMRMFSNLYQNHGLIGQTGAVLLCYERNSNLDEQALAEALTQNVLDSHVIQLTREQCTEMTNKWLECVREIRAE